MEMISENVRFFILLAKVQAVMSRRFDSGLGGLSLSEFIILYYLSQSEGEALRRIDLAEKVGLTASGVTRLLLPMEKIGLVKSGTLEKDARVRSVILASGGKRKLSEAVERAELLLEEILPADKRGILNESSDLFFELAARACQR